VKAPGRLREAKGGESGKSGKVEETRKEAEVARREEHWGSWLRFEG